MSKSDNDFFLFRDFSEPAFIIDAHGFILEANAAFIKRFFSNSVDVHGMNVYELLSGLRHEPGLSASRKMMVDSVIATGKHVVFDDESGGHVFRNNIYPIQSPEGEISRLLVLVQDITAQIEAEKKVRHTDGVYRALLDAIPGSVFILEEECLVHSCNDCARAIFGDRTGQIQQSDFLDLIVSDDRSRIHEKLRDLHVSGCGEAEEARMHTHNNRHRYDWFSINAQQAVIHDRRYNVLVCIDITQQKNEEARLANYKRWLTMAVESGNAGLWDWNVKTGEALWSKKVWSAYGIEKGEGKFPSFQLWEHSVHPDDRDMVVGALSEAVDMLADLNIEYRVIHQDGSVHWVLVIGKPVFRSEGEVNRYCGIVIDITDQKDLEEDIALTREQVYAALEKFNIGWFHVNLKDFSAMRTLEHAKIFGYDSLDPNWSFDSFIEHVVDEDRERVRKNVMESIRNHKDYVLQCHIMKTNGEKRRIWVSGSFQYNDKGNATHILGMVQDITDRMC